MRNQTVIQIVTEYSMSTIEIIQQHWIKVALSPESPQYFICFLLSTMSFSVETRTIQLDISIPHTSLVIGIQGCRRMVVGVTHSLNYDQLQLPEAESIERSTWVTVWRRWKFALKPSCRVPSNGDVYKIGIILPNTLVSVVYSTTAQLFSFDSCVSSHLRSCSTEMTTI